MENNWPFPAGFKFCPTDEEILLHYLEKKVKNLPLPSNIPINHVRLYDYTPDHLAAKYHDNGQKEWYFFTVREKKSKWSKNKINRVVAKGDGYWRASQTVDPVRDAGAIIGFKRNLAFFQGKKKTNWLMSEYFSETSQACNAANNSGLEFDLALCKIYDKDHRKGGDRRAPCSGTVTAVLPESYCTRPPASAFPPTHDIMHWSSAIPESSFPQPPASPSTDHSMYWSSDISESPCPQSLASSPLLQNSVVLSDNIPESYCPRSPASSLPPTQTHHSKYWSSAIPGSSCHQSPASASPRTHHSMHWSSAISESSCPQSPASATPSTHHSMYRSSATPDIYFPQLLASAPPPAHCSMYWNDAIPGSSLPQHPASAPPPAHHSKYWSSPIPKLSEF